MRHQLLFAPTGALYVIIHHKRSLPAEKLFAFFHSAHATLLLWFAIKQYTSDQRKLIVSYCTSYCHSGQTIINNFLVCEVKCICKHKVFSTIMLHTTSKQLPNAIILPAMKVLSGLGWCKLSSTRIKELVGR